MDNFSLHRKSIERQRSKQALPISNTYQIQLYKTTTSESRLGDNISFGDGLDKSKPSDPGKL